MSFCVKAKRQIATDRLKVKESINELGNINQFNNTDS